MEVDLGPSHAHHTQVLLAVTLDLFVYLTNFNLLLDVFKEAGSSLAGWFNSVLVNRFIGVDLIHYLGPLQLVSCLQDWAFSVLADLAHLIRWTPLFPWTDPLSVKYPTSLSIRYMIK